MVSDLAFHIARTNKFSVEVVTSRQEYGNADSLLPSMEVIDGVRIWRIWTTRFGRQNLFGRGLDYVTFYLAAAVRLFSRARRGDIVVAKTDPPLISVVAALIGGSRGATLVNWIQDLFPEVATALSVTAIRPIEPVLRRLRNWSLTAAHCNIVLGDHMAGKLVDQGVPREKIAVIHNWSDEGSIHPISRRKNPLRQEWGLADRFVVGYSGNMGRAHDFDTIIDAAERLKDNKKIQFLFVGGGAQKNHIADEVERRKLTNVTFKPYQPRTELSLSLCVPDLHLITLLPALEGLIVPSKFYGIAAAGRPTLFIGDQDGEIARILGHGNCGFVVRNGETNELVRLIKTFSDDQDMTSLMGKNARRLLEREFSKTVAASKWEQVFSTAV